MKNLKRVTGRAVTIPLPTDARGYRGHQCPSAACRGYFKVKPGTGLSGTSHCICPYCGHKADVHDFLTPDQQKFVRSYGKRMVADAFHRDLKDMFDGRRYGGGLFNVTVSVKAGQREPLHRYDEKDLETDVTCEACTLDYAVFGAFAFCPDCGEHNSLAILEKSFTVIEKTLAIASNQEIDLATHWIGNCLEDAVSAFDGFGREVCRRAAPRASSPEQAEKISFQNVVAAERKLGDLFGVSMATAISPDEWKTACAAFQKRHLLAHSMGVIDEKYIAATGEPASMKGRKVRISADEVAALVAILRTLASTLRSRVV